MFVERRASPRAFEFKRAEIVFNDDRSRIACIVVNASAGGAMLRVRDEADVPHTFSLHLDDKIHAAWVVWKNNGALGINWID
jgi:PilZ domain